MTRALLPSDPAFLELVAALLGYLGGILAALAALVFLRRRHVRRRQRRRGRVGDAEIRAILERGRVEVEEPLDLEEIREEEKRFWEEERWE